MRNSGSDPLAQTFSVLRAHRQAGVSFTVAWPRAVAAAPKDWQGALLDTESAWRCAYDRTGDVAERVMTQLAGAA